MWMKIFLLKFTIFQLKSIHIKKLLTLNYQIYNEQTNYQIYNEQTNYQIYNEQSNYHIYNEQNLFIVGYLV